MSLFRETSDERRATGFIDTHAHITFPEFDKDRGEVLSRAWEAGLECIIAIGAGNGLEGNEGAVKFAEADERIFAAIGIHPHDAKDCSDCCLKTLGKLALDPKVVAIGEIGLDYYHKHSSPDIQRGVFEKLIKFACDVDKPIIIHDRDAHKELETMLGRLKLPRRGGVFHCFSGDVGFARRMIDAGFYISITGVVTFAKSDSLCEVVAGIPLEKMVIETDCPYLAPEPHRGKRNEPAYVVRVAEKIAKIKGLSVNDVARVTTLNARRLFNLPGADVEAKIAYEIRNSLYLNITNRCNLACRFCPKYADRREEGYEVKGHYLKLEREPDVDDVFKAAGLPQKYDEVVFCGYGEPTTRIELLKVIAKRMKEQGAKKVRLNTDGLANLVYGRNVLLELAGIIDSVSVSLNAPDPVSYAANCPSKFGEAAYAAVCDFIVEAKKHVPEVVASVVALPGLDIEACEKKAKELGVKLRVREYMSLG